MIYFHGKYADIVLAHPQLVVVGGLLLAIALYWLRCALRSVYGLIEVAAGIALLIIVSISMNARGDFDTDMFSNDFDIFRVGIQSTAFIGGLFAIIRGFDSIVLGWGETRKSFARYFPLSARQI